MDGLPLIPSSNSNLLVVLSETDLNFHLVCRTSQVSVSETHNRFWLQVIHGSELVFCAALFSFLARKKMNKEIEKFNNPRKMLESGTVFVAKSLAGAEW